MPLKHREKRAKLLSARRWHFFKNFFSAQLRELQDVKAQSGLIAPRIRLQKCLRFGTFFVAKRGASDCAAVCWCRLDGMPNVPGPL
jgi:hypothetical protein